MFFDNLPGNCKAEAPSSRLPVLGRRKLLEFAEEPVPVHQVQDGCRLAPVGGDQMSRRACCVDAVGRGARIVVVVPSAITCRRSTLSQSRST